MKYLTLLTAVIALPLTLGVAHAADKQGYYRPRTPHRTAIRPAQASAPVVVNAASFEAGVSPGGLATVYGTDLTSVTGVLVASSDPLPTVLGGVSVTVNGIPAPLFSVAYANGVDQISFQVPYETAVGPGAVEADVFDQGTQTAAITADSFTEDPGIFVYGNDYAIAASPTDGSLIGPDNPANPGEVLVLYTTGLGPLSLNLPDGARAPFDPLAYTIDPVNVFVNNESCEVLFSGLAPGFVGLYQVNFRLPGDLPPGNLDIEIQTPYANSAVATLPVD